MYDDSIELIQNKESSNITNYNVSDTGFVTIDINGHVAKVSEKSTGIFTADTQINFIDVNSKKESIYTATGACKDIYAYGNIVAMNMGSEVHFVNTSGWLSKKYISTQEIKDVVIGSRNCWNSI